MKLDKEELIMEDDLIPELCENDCIMNLIDPVCDKCQTWYQYWADIDNSELDWYLKWDRGIDNK